MPHPVSSEAVETVEERKARWRSVSIAASAMPSRKPQAAAGARMEAQMAVDHPAYRRLRANGLKPPSTVGAAALEAQATTAFEIEAGQILPNVKSKERQIREGMDISREIGMLPPTTKES
jgi:hypothetical protein